jgi:inner membrane protein
LCWRWPTARQHPWRWLAVLALPLLTHPLLDSLTVYGTQLFWPLDSAPVMGGSLFIIDPLYTLPLLIAVLVAALSRIEGRAHRAVQVGLGMSCVYIGWSLAAQAWIDRIAERTLVDTPHANAPRLVVATPFNTLLWRIVVQTPEGYLEGDYSLWADRGPIGFAPHTFDRELLEQAS